MTDPDHFCLSESGRQRRQAMLSELQREMAAWHGRRRRGRRLIAGTTVLITALAGWWWGHGLGRWEDARIADHPTVSPPPVETVDPAERRRSWIQIVESRPEVSDRYLVSNEDYDSLPVRPVTDDELLQLLADVGQAAVWARIDGKLTLLAIR